MAVRENEGKTAQMRGAIHNQIQVWATQAKWVDEAKADRLFAKVAEVPEDYISPDPETCGSYREEASRIYGELKDEHGLRTLAEAAEETDEAYEDERQSAAADKLREEFDAIENGEREGLVADLTAAYGEEFVTEVLADERNERLNAHEQMEGPTPTAENDQVAIADGGTETAPESETGPYEQYDRTPDVTEYYWKLRDYVRMVVDKKTNALLLEAGPGIGKSYQISQTLNREVGKKGWRKVSGHCTPVELYHELFEASDGKVLFLDDIEGLIDNKSALALLKQATWSESNERHVEWRSTSSTLDDVPEKFRFKGRIIMCFNEVPDDKIFDSLEDRCLTYRISFTYSERLDICREVAKSNYKGLSFRARMEVVDWIEDNSGPADKVNLRMLFHIFDMRDFSERWQELAVEQLDADEETMLIRRLLDEHDTVKGACSAYEEETGKSRRTFFRRRKEITGDE